MNILREKKYCGLREPLPQGYTRYGNRYECLRTGFGVAKYVGNNQRVAKRQSIMITMIWIGFIILLFTMIGMIGWMLMITRTQAQRREDDDE